MNSSRCCIRRLCAVGFVAPAIVPAHVLRAAPDSILTPAEDGRLAPGARPLIGNSTYRAPSSPYPPRPKANFHLEPNFGSAELPPDYFSPRNALTGDFIGGARHE